MAFKNEERGKRFLNGTEVLSQILGKATDGAFESTIQRVSGMTREERIREGRDIRDQMMEYIQDTLDYDATQSGELVFSIILMGSRMACLGLPVITRERKTEIAGYLFGPDYIEEHIEEIESLFNSNEVKDENYQALMRLCCMTREPLLSPWPNSIFTYLILAAHADTVNETGLRAIRKLRRDFLEFAPQWEADHSLVFEGSLEISSDEQRGEPRKGGEEGRKETGDAWKKELEERRGQIGKFSRVRKGDKVLFGCYPKYTRKQPERIEWIVLDRKGDKLLLLSKYILDIRSFHKSWKIVPWEDSLIRSWLNKTFFSKAFIEEEQRIIIPTTIDEADSEGAMHRTVDKVFLLSEAEARQYMPTTEGRKAEGTRVADTAYWGLRSCVKGMDFRYVTGTGRLMSNQFSNNDYIHSNYDFTIGVRPAMWVTAAGTSVKSPDGETGAASLHKIQETRRSDAEEEARRKAAEAEAMRQREEERARKLKAAEQARHEKILAATRDAIKEVRNMICVSDKESVMAVVTLEGKVITSGMPQDIQRTVESWTNIRQVCMYFSREFETNYVAGLKWDGTVVFTGTIFNEKIDVSSWRDIVQIASGFGNVYGLTKYGTVVAVGNNSSNQLSSGHLRNITRVLGSVQTCLALRKDGSLSELGMAFHSYELENEPRHDYVDFTISTEKSNMICGLLKDGTVYPPFDDLKYIYSLKDIVSVSKGIEGEIYITAVDLNGNVKIASSDGRFQGTQEHSLGWTNMAYITAGAGIIAGITRDGYVKVRSLTQASSLNGMRLFQDYRYIPYERAQIAEAERQKRIEGLEAEIAKLEAQKQQITGLFANQKKAKLQEQIDRLNSQIQAARSM